MIDYLGVDLGGTNFKAGIVRDGIIISESINAVDRNLTETELIETLFKTIDTIITKNTQGVGVGIPGIVDPNSGVIYNIQNLPNWEEVSLKTLLEQRYNLPVFLNNDANCFAKGEKVYGSGKPYTCQM